MIIVHARHKRTHYKVMAFEGLMYRWRQVNSSGDRFKIVNRKNVRIAETIPANGIKRMCGIDKRINNVFLLYHHGKLTGFIMCLQVLRFAEIAFAVGAVFFKLTKLIAVAFRCLNSTERVNYQQTVFRSVEVQLKKCASRDNDIITIAKIDR